MTDPTDATPPAQRGDTSSEVAADRYVGALDLTRWYTPAGRVLARVVRGVGARIGPNAALILTLVVGLAVAVGLSAGAAQIYDNVTDKDGVAGLDAPLLAAVMQWRSPFLDQFITSYTDLAGTIGMPVTAVAVMTILAVHRRSWTPVILIIAAGSGSLLMTVAGKDLIGRARPALADAVPPYEYSPSFPSGHTLNAIVVAGIIAYLLVLRQHSTRARVITIGAASFFALTVGLSRVFLGHHWFTDVLAGWALGAAWLALVITAHRLYLTTRKTDAEGSAPRSTPRAGLRR